MSHDKVHVCLSCKDYKTAQDGDLSKCVDCQSMVNHPEHYNQGSVECIDAIASATVNLTGIEAFCTGSAIKYLFRWKHKNGVEDLDKAIWYIERLKKEIQDEKELNAGQD